MKRLCGNRSGSSGESPRDGSIETNTPCMPAENHRPTQGLLTLLYKGPCIMTNTTTGDTAA